MCKLGSGRVHSIIRIITQARTHILNIPEDLMMVTGRAIGAGGGGGYMEAEEEEK